MTQAPDREREHERRRPEPSKRPERPARPARPALDERPARARRPEPAARPAAVPPKSPKAPVAGKGEGVDKSAWSKGVVIANAALILVVAIVGVRYTQSQHDDGADASAAAPQGSASVPEPSASSDVASAPAVPASSAAPVVPVVAAPVVKATMRSDFSKVGWPSGADPRNAGSVRWPIGVVDGVLTHGAPTGSSGVSWLQKWMRTDVRRIGARVRFAPNHRGEAALTAWFSSILDASLPALPKTGMRLVVTHDSWRLVALTGGPEKVMAQGSYQGTGRTASFDLVRKGSTVWVTDPAGVVTQVDDARIGRFSGPWATWELREDKAGQRPAAFEEIWAG